MYKEDSSERYKSQGYKFFNDKGINFNIEKNAFLNKKNMHKDTLCISNLNRFNLLSINKLKNLEIKQRKAYNQYVAEYRKQHGIPPPPINRNHMFDTYIIEKIRNDKIVVYKAIFRNEGVIN